MYLRRRALLTAAKQAIFRLRTGRLGPLALILTVAAVQTVGATIMPGCFGNRGLSCRGTKSSNPSPSSGESAANRFLPRGSRTAEEDQLVQRLSMLVEGMVESRLDVR